MPNTIHQEVVIPASCERVYEALLDSAQFGELTSAPAEIGREAGASFSGFGGKIVGRQVELIPNQRVVQAWRVANWDEGVYSIVRFELQSHGSDTRLIFDHIGFPAEEFEHLEGGWHKMYWEPLRKYLAKAGE